MFAKLVLLFAVAAVALSAPQSLYPGYGYGGYSALGYPSGYYGYSGYSNPLAYTSYGSYSSPYNNYAYGYY